MTGCPTSDHWALPSHGYYLPQFSRRSGIVHCQEVAQLKELGVLNPPQVPERPPLFPPLVPSTRGKVVSTALGAPPPEINADGIGQSLTTDRDEESILSDSYSDRHSATADSSIMWGRHLGHSLEQKPWTTERRDKDSYRSSDKDHAIGIAIGNVTGPKRETSGMVQNGPVSALHDAKTTTVSAAVLTSANVRADMRVLSMTAKQSRGTGPVPVHRAAAGGHTPPNINLCHLHPCHIQHL